MGGRKLFLSVKCLEVASVPSPPDGQQVSHKEESRKLKAFIVKMKKELSEAKERVTICLSSTPLQPPLQPCKWFLATIFPFFRRPP